MDSTPEGLEAFHGPMIIAYGASAFLFGVITSKTASYVRSYGNKDPTLLKGTIFAVWFLELVHSCIACAIIYTTLVKFPGLPCGPSQLLTVFAVNGMVSVLIACIVQNYSAYRLYKITKSSWAPVLVVSISSMRTVVFFIGTIVQVGPFPYLQEHAWRKVMTSVGILAILTDSILAVALGHALWKRRQERQALRANMDPTSCLLTDPLLHHVFEPVDELLLFCTATNISTSLSMIVVFVLYHLEKNLIWLPISYVQTRMYALSFIALLLERRRPNPSISTPQELLNLQTFPSQPCQRDSCPAPGSIQVAGGPRVSPSTMGPQDSVDS